MTDITKDMITLVLTTKCNVKSVIDETVGASHDIILELCREEHAHVNLVTRSHRLRNQIFNGIGYTIETRFQTPKALEQLGGLGRKLKVGVLKALQRPLSYGPEFYKTVKGPKGSTKPSLNDKYPHVRGGYLKVKKFAIEDVLPFITSEDGVEHIFGTMSVKVHSLRLQTFKTYGTACKFCGLQATHFWLESSCGARQLRQAFNAGSRFVCANRPHFNLYGINERGHEVMMTCDHIHPLSKGGADKLHNMQPLCQPCNEKKGATLEISCEG